MSQLVVCDTTTLIKTEVIISDHASKELTFLNDAQSFA